ncbi:MAG: IS630 family transposase [Mucilaginibacter sp.]|uniref:IS630 family transposase n=1 Tax=Mucilaginibacter sp. TaxID=1882438 RepID=UPI003265AED6
MSRQTISKTKQTAIGRMVIAGTINIKGTARQLRVSRNTVKRYVNKYEPFAATYPDWIVGSTYRLPIFKSVEPAQAMQEQLFAILSNIVHAGATNLMTITEVWEKYLQIRPHGYKRSSFNNLFSRWCKENKVNLHQSWHVSYIPESDLAIFRQWLRSGNKRKWERATVILASKQNKPTVEIAAKVDHGVDCILDWIRSYKKQGITALEKKPRRANEALSTGQQEKRANLIRLIHESPKLHGFNRTSWFQADLSAAYQKRYGTAISTSSISEYLKKEGYVYRKAREVLTSPDPDFREKMDKIKAILNNLGQKEKFFSVDEFGPFAVKIKGGRSLVKRGERKTYPQIQKSKGFTICTAALELSANQITHFYSNKKNTDEMIKLIGLLLIKYKNEEKLYFSWDAASWHASRKLNEYIDDINSHPYRAEHATPLVELAPLPASAQFLNVIESVFSGLAKSVIHNSDYSCLEECQSAITQYFQTRNKHFIAHPHKAGNKIWGKELVVPAFKDSHNCKDPKYR